MRVTLWYIVARNTLTVISSSSSALVSLTQRYDGIRPLKKETQLALWISLRTLCRIDE
jgi:hypothetical protein